MKEQKGPPPENSCAGNPINIASGNKFQAEVDYQAGSASSLSFSRTYNSLDGLWRNNYSAYLRFAQNSVTLAMQDGREHSFIHDGINGTSTSTVLGRLTKTTEGWSYLSRNNESYSFDSLGRLTRLSNINGAEQQIAYNEGVITVTDHLGNSLSFTKNAQRQPLSLSAGELKIIYDYDTSNRLTQLSRTRGSHSELRKFHYEDLRNNTLLTGITDERGIRYATWTYDEQGRAISSEHADGADRVTVNYGDNFSTVTNELGKKTTYRFAVIDGSRRITAIEGQPSANCPDSNSSFTYDERGLLKSKTDNKGHVTTFDYNERGLEVSRTEAYGTTEARTITTEWHPTLYLPAVVTEPNRIIRYQYDEQGRQLSRTVDAL